MSNWTLLVEAPNQLDDPCIMGDLMFQEVLALAFRD